MTGQAVILAGQHSTCLSLTHQPPSPREPTHLMMKQGFVPLAFQTPPALWGPGAHTAGLKLWILFTQGPGKQSVSTFPSTSKKKAMSVSCVHPCGGVNIEATVENGMTAIPTSRFTPRRIESRVLKIYPSSSFFCCCN